MMNGSCLRNLVMIGLASAVVAGCATSSITQVAENQAIIDTRSGPDCGPDGVDGVAAQMAAVATIRQGYERYELIGGDSRGNSRAFIVGPTYSAGTGPVSIGGSGMYSRSTTKYGMQQFEIGGRNNPQFAVLMYNSGEPGYENAQDARAVLGPSWQDKVANGIDSCG